MIDIVKVVALRVVGDNSLWLRFSDGQVGVRECSDILAEGGPMVEPLREPAVFARAFLSFGVPAWPNGFDLDAIQLHAELRDAGALKRAAVAQSRPRVIALKHKGRARQARPSNSQT